MPKGTRHLTTVKGQRGQHTVGGRILDWAEVTSGQERNVEQKERKRRGDSRAAPGTRKDKKLGRCRGAGNIKKLSRKFNHYDGERNT